MIPRHYEATGDGCRSASALRMNVARATVIPRYGVRSPRFSANPQSCALFVAENAHKCSLAGGREPLLFLGDFSSMGPLRPPGKGPTICPGLSNTMALTPCPLNGVKACQLTYNRTRAQQEGNVQRHLNRPRRSFHADWCGRESNPGASPTIDSTFLQFIGYRADVRCDLDMSNLVEGTFNRGVLGIYTRRRLRTIEIAVTSATAMSTPAINHITAAYWLNGETWLRRTAPTVSNIATDGMRFLLERRFFTFLSSRVIVGNDDARTHGTAVSC